MEAFTFRAERLRKLVTHEDAFHIHKTLGAISLAHYLYRFYEWFTIHDMFATTPNHQIIAWSTIHMALSASSLIFKIPQNRVKGSPMIWPEFRAHSIAFAFRSLLGMIAIALLNDTLAIRIALVIGTIVAADLATSYYSKLDNKLGTTMRGMPYPESFTEPFKRRLNLYYSFSQVLATLNILYAPDHGTLFIAAFAIQIAAFLMTLVRKGVITGAGWHILYAASLALNYAYGITCVGICRMTPSHTAAYWSSAIIFALFRFHFRQNKYLLWFAACVLRLTL